MTKYGFLANDLNPKGTGPIKVLVDNVECTSCNKKLPPITMEASSGFGQYTMTQMRCYYCKEVMDHEFIGPSAYLKGNPISFYCNEIEGHLVEIKKMVNKNEINEHLDKIGVLVDRIKCEYLGEALKRLESNDD